MEALVYVESAPQLFVAISALQIQGIDTYDVLVRTNGSEFNDRQITCTEQRLRKIFSLNKPIFTFGLRDTGFTLVRMLLAKKYDAVYVADIRSPIAIMLCAIFRRRIIVLDDGIATISARNSVRSGASLFEGNRLKALFWSLTFRSINSIEFHSFIPCDLSPLQFRYLDRSMIGIASKANQRKIGLIVGGKIEEIGMAPSGFISKVVDEIVSMHSDVNWIYVPHREESVKFFNQPQVNVVRYDFPIELVFGVDEAIPTMVIGFTSAALLYFQSFNELCQVRYIRIRLENSNAKFHLALKSTFSLFDEIGIKELCVQMK